MDRCRMIAALMQNHAEQVQAVKMIGLYRKNLVINPSRVCQLTRLMQCKTFGKQ